MQQFLLILYYKAKSSLHTMLMRKRGGVLKTVASVIIYTSFTYAAFSFSRFITHYLLDVWRIGLYLFHQFLAMGLFVFFMTISLGNMIVSYATLYRSPEVGFLMTQPVSHQKIFLLKFFDNFFYSSTTLILISAAVLGGYGSYFGFQWTVYVFIMFGVLFPYMVMAACIGVSLLLMLLMWTRYVNPRQLIAIIIGVYLLSVYFYFRANNPFMLVNEVMKYYPNIDQYFLQVQRPLSPLLPNQLVGQILYFCAYHSFTQTVIPLMLLIGVTGGMLTGVFFAARRYYYRSWLLAMELRNRRSGWMARLITFFSFRSRSLWGPRAEVYLKKEYWTFLREPSQWLHLAILIFLTLVFVFGVSGARYRAGNPVLQTTSYLTIYLFNGFLIASMALRFLFPSISLEGQMLWTLRSAPLRMEKIILMKLGIGIAGVLALAVPLSFLSTYPWRMFPPLVWFAVWSAVVVSVGFVTLNLGMGGIFADFLEKNPVRIASSQGASISFLLSLGYLAVIVVFAIVPIQQYYFYIMEGSPPSTANLAIISGFALALTLVIAAGAVKAAVSGLGRDL